MSRIVTAEQRQIRLNARCRWIHRDEPFLHPRIIEFFHRAIRLDDDGACYLHNVVDGEEERVYFVAEDTPFFVMAFELDESKRRVRLVLNVGKMEEQDAECLKPGEGGVLYARTADGHLARFTEEALVQIAEHAREEDDGIFLDLAGERIRIA